MKWGQREQEKGAKSGLGDSRVPDSWDEADLDNQTVGLTFRTKRDGGSLLSGVRIRRFSSKDVFSLPSKAKKNRKTGVFSDQKKVATLTGQNPENLQFTCANDMNIDTPNLP